MQMGVAPWGVRRMIGSISGSDPEVLAVFDVFTSASVIGGATSPAWLDARGGALNGLATAPLPMSCSGHGNGGTGGSGNPGFSIPLMAFTASGVAGTNLQWMRSSPQANINCSKPLTLVVFATAPSGSSQAAASIDDPTDSSGMYAYVTGSGAVPRWGAESADNGQHCQTTVSGSAITYVVIVISNTASTGNQLCTVYNEPQASVSLSTGGNESLSGQINLFCGPSPQAAATSGKSYFASCNVKGVIVINHVCNALEIAALGQYGIARYGCTQQ